MSPPATFDGLFLKDGIIQFIYDLLMTRWSCLRNTPKCLNDLTLIATFGIGISLFTESTEGCSTQIPGYPHLSNLGFPV